MKNEVLFAVISKSIRNATDVLASGNITHNQRTKLIDVIGTLQAVLVALIEAIPESSKFNTLPDKQASLKKLMDAEEFENGAEEAERFTDWMNDQAEQQNFNHENN
jgi:hypothetical protein